MRVGIAPDLRPAQLYQILITVYDPDTLEPLPPTTSNGAPTPTFAGWLKSTPAMDIPSDAILLDQTVRFGEVIALRAYRLVPGLELRLVLYWESLVTIQDDYTVFVHLIDSEGNVVAQGDSPPRGGQYPTWAWEAGEVIEDEHSLSIPQGTAGPLRILVGLYSITTGERLSLLKDGLPVSGNAVELSLPEAMP